MATKIINTNKVGNTINFKFVLSGSPEWADGVYWGNAEIFDNHITETSNYYVAFSDGSRDDLGFEIKSTLGSRTYEEPSEYDCGECFKKHTAGWDEEEKAYLRQSLIWNGQHVCGTGYSFSCPYADNGVDKQAGIEYDEVENLLKTAGIM